MTRIHNVHSDTVMARNERRRFLQHGRRSMSTTSKINWPLHAMSLVLVLGAVAGWVVV